MAKLAKGKKAEESRLSDKGGRSQKLGQWDANSTPSDAVLHGSLGDFVNEMSGSEI